MKEPQPPKCPWCGRMKSVVPMDGNWWCKWCQKLFDRKGTK
jgi:hypothetical protein